MLSASSADPGWERWKKPKKEVNGKSPLRKIKWILQQCSNLTKATRRFQNSVILREVSIKAIFLRRWLKCRTFTSDIFYDIQLISNPFS